MPDNKAARMDVLLTRLAAEAGPAGQVRAFTDFRNDKLCLVVEFPSHISKKIENRSAVIDLLFEQFGDIIVVPQS